MAGDLDERAQQRRERAKGRKRGRKKEGKSAKRPLFVDDGDAEFEALSFFGSSGWHDRWTDTRVVSMDERR
jgi:hypothetical protein